MEGAPRGGFTRAAVWHALSFLKVTMETFYVACDLGADHGRISLGALHQGRLRLSEIRRFPNEPLPDGEGRHWDIPTLYQNLMDGLADVARTDEPVQGISCDSWGQDYMLFDAEGSLITPTCAPPPGRMQDCMREVLARTPREVIFEETGIPPTPDSTLFQLAAEKSRKLSKASKLLPVADGFNYLLSGQARVEASQASTTQLFNPLNKSWSRRLLETLRLPPQLLPPVVPAGTVLGPLRVDIARQTGLDEVNVVSSCSHELASAIAGLPASGEVHWAFLRLGSWSLLGTELPQPVVSSAARDLDFANEAGIGGTTLLTKHTAGLRIVEECQRYWAEHEQSLDWDLMMHLAASSPPFESLINPMDRRFLTPEDMPLKVREFCRESGQPIPRKPGPIIRCVLESIALYYRKVLKEMESVTGRKPERLYIIGGGGKNPLFHHFITNALQVPVITTPDDMRTIGNVLTQAIALGHVSSLDEARRIVRDSFRFQTFQPHAAVWNTAFERLEKLT